MIVAGFGCRAGATTASFESALAATGFAQVDTLAIPADRVGLLQPLAAHLAISVMALEPDRLACIVTSTRSAASLAARGTGSVAEAAALAACGSGARLLRPRAIGADRMATCAIATNMSEGPRL